MTFALRLERSGRHYGLALWQAVGLGSASMMDDGGDGVHAGVSRVILRCQQEHMHERRLDRRAVAAPERRDRVMVRMQVRRDKAHADGTIRRPFDPMR